MMMGEKKKEKKEEEEEEDMLREKSNNPNLKGGEKQDHGLEANVSPCRTHDETARRATKEGDSGLQDLCFQSF